MKKLIPHKLQGALRLAIKKDHSKIMGIDFDPKGDMQLDVKDDGDCEV